MSEKKWSVKDGVIYITVVLACSIETQIMKLESLGFKISNRAKEILLYGDFPISIEIELEIAILKGSDWHLAEKEAEKRGFTKSPHQIALFLREKVSDQDLVDMGLSFLLIANKIESEDPGQPYSMTLKIGPNKSLLCRGLAK